LQDVAAISRRRQRLRQRLRLRLRGVVFFIFYRIK